MPHARSKRDIAMTALILGFLASAWSGWAHEGTPGSWRSTFVVVAVLVAGVYGAIRAAITGRGAGTALPGCAIWRLVAALRTRAASAAA